MNRLLILGGVVIAALYVLFSSIYVVNVREQAILMRFGKITEVNTEPGLYFKLPTEFIDTVQIIEDRLLRFDATDKNLQVSDGATYVVDAFLTYRISDARKFRERAQGSLDLVEARISRSFDSALGDVYGKRDFDDALSVKRTEMMREARDLIRPGLLELGVDVIDVRIKRTDLDERVEQATFERMKQERLAQAAEIRAGGQQAAQTARAIADRRAVEIRAAASKDSEIIKGEGDATRNAIFAQAFGADPEFFEFYRSMQAYRAALGSAGTTMLLTPDSEFFAYFNGDSTDGKTPTPAAPGGIAPLAQVQLTEPVPEVAPEVVVPLAPAESAPAQ